MFGDGITCNFDGSPIYAPVIPDLPIASTWSKPASVNELIERVHPVETDGPLVEQMTRRRAETVSTWRRFFAGVEVTEEEQREICATLEPWRNSLQEYQSPTYAWRKELARIKFYLDKEMEAYAWLDNDPRAVLAATPQNIGQALAARAGFEFKLKTLTAE